ncbi:HNH endonuclease signature motif containing protein [Paenibacillus macerans]|uniref:HNH endonuclease signature motif containing protein n=1 Tax=Paenibacillus macerans TaxID=44252 RepID=UPI00203B2EEC|nr:HNH endonuclease signature motif containing protein [Paenibacillus macerans]MCM3699219.1 HNH endonuclease [Paenibacillus macerans]
MRRYTPEQKEFIRENAQGKYNSEIADLFYAEFGIKVTESQIKSFKANHKIKSDLLKRRRTTPEGLLSDEQAEFVISHVRGLSNLELTNLVNETFNLGLTTTQIKTWKNNHGLSSGLRGSEGQAPPNKGMKGLYNVGGNRTSFKKGQRAMNYKPVGSERIDRDGYTLIKVSDEGPWHKRWRHKHKVVWEEKHGPIPKGHVILFADQNKRNIDPDNLILIKQSQLSILNNKGLLHNDSELTKTGIIMADIYRKISERKRSGKGRS